jgi:hypothetical protein
VCVRKKREALSTRLLLVPSDAVPSPLEEIAGALQCVFAVPSPLEEIAGA